MSSHISVYRIQRRLIVSPGAIGDRVLARPAMAALRQRYPHLHITWMGSRDTDDLVSPTGLFDQILAQDITSLYTRTGKSRMRLFWICQGMARTRINHPLCIHGEHDMVAPIAAYSRHFEDKKR